MAETFRQGCQNCYLSFKKTSPRKIVFCHFSPMNCWYWARNSQPFCVKISAGFSKLHPRCPGVQWLGKNTLSSNCFCYLGTFRWNILAFWWKLLGIVPENQFTCQEIEFDGIRFFCFSFCLELLILSKNFSTFLCKKFRRVFETASYLSRGAMTGRKHFVLELFLLFSDIQIKNFSLLVDTSRHCCRKAIYVSRSWVWRKPFFCYFSAMNCWYWAKNLQHFGVKVLAGFSKQRPTCSEEQWIGENSF